MIMGGLRTALFVCRPLTVSAIFTRASPKNQLNLSCGGSNTMEHNNACVSPNHAQHGP